MIRLAACGVCHSDLSATNGTIAYLLPLVLGHEGAGIVTAVGEGVSRYAIGDHVVSSFVSICGRCHVTGQDPIGKALYKLTGGGADYAFDCVGLGRISEQAFGVLRRGGTAVTVGIAAPADQIVLNAQHVAITEKTLTGSYYGSARPQLDFPRLIGLYRSGRLKLDELITRTYSIDEAPQAFTDLQGGRPGRGVIVFAEMT
ncbi:MAG: alcohol dehydrogenase catalytic domain-containing protein [Steroidobacterales bacterium]